ncbi:MAG: penicillin-binding transpeptidase domain-containing protein [Fibrobacterota bacterium]
MASIPKKGRIRAVLFLIALTFFIRGLFSGTENPPSSNKKQTQSDESKIRIPANRDSLLRSAFIHPPFFPAGVSPAGLKKEDLTILPETQKRLEKLFNRYDPVVGAAVVMNADNGNLLSLISYSSDSKFLKKKNENKNWYIYNGFPAASIFKIITASALFEYSECSPETEFTVSGRLHTLYKNQINIDSKATRRIIFRKAFARSVNPIFGKIGLYNLGPGLLFETAENFWYNKEIPLAGGVPVGATIVADTGYQTAEIASGFNSSTTLSPVHGAMITASFVNGGKIISPSISKKDTGDIKLLGRTISEYSSEMMRSLMKETVEKGTARKSWKKIRYGRNFRKMIYGGKTGSLDSESPKGRCDWFTGFCADTTTGRKYSVAVVTVHDQYWTVRSAYLAAEAIISAFNETEPVEKTP